MMNHGIMLSYVYKYSYFLLLESGGGEQQDTFAMVPFCVFNP